MMSASRSLKAASIRTMLSAGRISASIRRTPEATPRSEVIRVRAISPELRT